MIAAMLEGVEEEFAGIAVNAFEGPPAAAVVPVSSHPQRGQRSLKLLFIVPSRRLYLESAENFRSTEKK